MSRQKATTFLRKHEQQQLMWFTKRRNGNYSNKSTLQNGAAHFDATKARCKIS
jgi:hypothetical protein